MKHKHAELIKAWADGAEIEFKDIDGTWVRTYHPFWWNTDEYRIKPEPRPQWQQDLIDAAKAGKVVEVKTLCGWMQSAVNKMYEKYEFIAAEQYEYRIRSEKVTRYLWAYKNIKNDWFVHQRFETESEAAYTAKKNQFVFKRLDYTATEFEE